MPYKSYDIYCEEALEDRLALCQYRAGNGYFNRKKIQQRPYKVFVKQSFPEFGIEPGINAFSLYEAKADYILILKFFLDFYMQVLQGVSGSKKEYTWMFHIGLFFCGFHEFAHLYLGHCQITSKSRIALTFSDNICKEASAKDVQAMEFEADMYAAVQLADFVREQIENKAYRRVWGYKRKEDFYSDVLKALCGFFSIMKYLEYKEQKKRSLGKREDYDHPSYLLREYLSGKLFLTLMEQYGFGKKEEEFYYYLLNTDSIYMKAPKDEEWIKHDYAAVFDGTIKSHIAYILDYCNQVLDKKTAPFTRLKACGTIKI